MNLKRTALASAVSALALGVSGQAAAVVYGLSDLEVQNLIITTTDNGGPALPTTFNFNLTNTATLDGAGDFRFATCSGVFGGANNCGPAGLRLDAQPAAIGVAPANNAFTRFGPGGDYSYSDSVIFNAQLLNDGRTDTHQIAESSLSSLNAASASAEIQSTTGFTYQFAIAGTGTLALDFEANPFLRVLIQEALAGNFAAQANMNASFSLVNDNTGDTINWNPQGTAANDCTVTGPNAGAINCVETADSEDLNINLGITTNSEVTHSAPDAFNPFGIFITGLTAGQWTLTLNAVTSTLLTRQVEEVVPEPSLLALLGIGLAGLGVMRRRAIPKK